VRCSGEYEDHISGDIALAFRQYILATYQSFNNNQSDAILSNLTEAAFAIADYWLSRVKYNQAQNVWDILGKDFTIEQLLLLTWI
jgi:trehalose/maltose hydrolase-like predicted phosphorylase